MSLRVRLADEGHCCEHDNRRDECCHSGMQQEIILGFAHLGRIIQRLDISLGMHHGDGVARCKKKTVYSGKSLPESFRPVEVEEHSILAALVPSVHLLERARRIDRLNRIDLSDLSDDSTADTTG